MSELEHGRYRLVQLPNGKGLLTRAVGLCDTCSNCKCGDKPEPIELPSAVIKAATGQPIEIHEVMGLAAALPSGFLKGLTGGGRPQQGDGTSPAAGQSRRAARRARRSPGGMGLPDQTADSPADPASTPVAG